MLHYEITKSYLSFIATLPFQERGNALWKSQSILSNAGGYLKMKVADLSEETSIFKIHDNTYILVYSDFQKIVLINGEKSQEIPSFNKSEETPLVSKTIKELLTKDDVSMPKDDLERFLEDNYFTSWFIKLLSYLPLEIRASLMSKNESVPASKAKEEKKEEQPIPQPVAKELIPTALKKKEEVIKRPVTKQAVFANPVIKTENNFGKVKSKSNVDGAQYEKAILQELQEAYAKRLEKRKQREAKQAPVPKQTLKHVSFAPKEIVIAYHDEGNCLDQLIKKTRQNGCHASNKDWLILLANTVDESFAKEIEYRYPGHVMYTDNPNKGKLRLAIIVKYKEASFDEEEDLGIKRVKSKQASFQKELPSGAFENVDDEDYWEAQERKGDSEIRRVKSKVANFQSSISIDQVADYDDDEIQKDGDGYLMDFDDDFSEPKYDESTDFEEPLDSDEQEEKPAYPRYWHCYICGKKKSYSGEPAETVKLSSGKIVYLCKKHRGKM